jgi:RNA polymerase sigma-70 factor (ECF subfamily)
MSQRYKNREIKKDFGELIQVHQGIIHKITRIYSGTNIEREDLFQEICLQLWKSYPNFRKESSFSTWLYRVALNTAISTIRKNNKSIQTEALENFEHPVTERPENSEHAELLYRAIYQLSNIDKAIILLWLEEKDYREIARIIGISKSNISVKLVRIKRKLEIMINQNQKLEK